ncbi:LacI family DNA-binding transcriptional regulator [uncultured Tessaracoccus sp.]|uniref:LacI family DNA-binding transcriptional regulator n=1 Tax=uncultured Tessaracoccus sp. TaxID=905023 RepID=UPI0025CE455F|nr:LacI family DNA-binding transcriptional regulator [uncultured Tessaracoccus sp.]
MRRVTISDVAEAAGVSVSTISKVVNGRDGIAPATQERVRRVIHELGYVTNLGARALRSTRTGVIGVLVSEFEPYSAEILKGVGQAAKGSDHELMAWAGTTSDPSAKRGWEQRLLGKLGGSLIDAAIIVTPSDALGPSTVPLVAVDPRVIDDDQPSVFVDDEGGLRAAVQHVLELGHERIGFLAGRDDLASAVARERGFRSAMLDAGLTPDEELIQRGDYSEAGAAQPATTLLDHPRRPTAIVAANDASALAVLSGARERDIRVPEELSVIGFDDIPEAARHAPPLTTVAQPLRELGRMAFTMLAEQLAGQTPDPVHRQLDTDLVVRRTTGPCPARAPE